ncbi:hypothetical protein QWZ16_11825 [Vibrio ostreicida]|uniref:Uncharacterized protein n=1 Tax=Vibrio ostreicida TaxID=526588 RepID=A0ABT8BUQ2_9VIBR|nr:hypothetical protein [Vibrio ostreicida]MDN3610393.1 hypothetical protein [Vibrio ostreicida]
MSGTNKKKTAYFGLYLKFLLFIYSFINGETNKFDVAPNNDVSLIRPNFSLRRTSVEKTNIKHDFMSDKWEDIYDTHDQNEQIKLRST